MAYNDQKITKILLDEITKIEDRHEGYRENIEELLRKVLELERGHLLSQTNIVKKIHKQINVIGMELYKAKSKAIDYKE